MAQAPWGGRSRHADPDTPIPTRRSRHADPDTIVTFRRLNKVAIEAAFLQTLLLAQETGLLKVGNVSIDGTKIDANAARAKSLRYDRAKEPRETLKADIAALMAQAADAKGGDPQALPTEIARREARIAKPDAASNRLKARAKAEAEAARPADKAKGPLMMRAMAKAANQNRRTMIRLRNARQI
jgi:cell division protein FtsB